MRRVTWTAAALADLASIRAYIGQFNPTAAQRMAARIVTAADSLADHADRGRPVGLDRRQLAVVPPYLIGYRVRRDDVQIIRVRHGARLPD